ncbi:hypothetical protein HY642_01070 [Candidatus Woesearchaeota archaeon]|nr:hypothetical protein [Candidatus Woesearchaeota archaeon]
MRKWLLVGLTAALLILIAHPVRLTLLAWIAFVPLLLALTKAGFRQGFLYGFAAALPYFTLEGYWLYIYNPLALAALVLTFSAFVGVACGLISWLWQRVQQPIPALLIPSIVWVGLAYPLQFTLLDNYWAFIADYQPLILLQSVSVIGVSGLFFAILLVNSFACLLVNRRSGRSRLPSSLKLSGLIIAGIIAVLIVFGAAQLSKPEHQENVKVAIVQPDLPFDWEWRETHQDEILSVLSNLSLQAKGVDIIVWPEYNIVDDYDELPTVYDIANKTGAMVVLGTYRGETNIAPLFTKDRVVAEYAAIHRPPFREQDIGTENTVFTAEWANFSAMLCYDGTSSRTTRGFVQNGAEILFWLLNENQFINTTEPDQSFERAVLRAIETGRYVVRANPSGYSAIIDPHGRIVAKTKLNERTVLYGSVARVTTNTIYATTGDVAGLISSVALIIVLLAAFGGKRGNYNRKQ